MARAAVDLPDPLDAPPTAQPGSTDDLLAQLASEEIDRLLADTETDHIPLEKPPGPATPTLPASETAPPPAGTTSDALPLSAAHQQDLSSQLDELLDSVADSTSSASPEFDLSSSSAPATVRAEPAPPPPAPPPSIQQNMTSAPVPMAAAPLLAAASDDGATSAAERLGLGVPDPLPLLEASEDEDAVRGPSLLVRLLEVINAPVLACPEGVRETIGKIAIVTLLNAVAVFVYVLFFRH